MYNNNNNNKEPQTSEVGFVLHHDSKGTCITTETNGSHWLARKLNIVI